MCSEMFTCSFWQDGKRMIITDNIKEFKSFRRIFAQNIMEQGWLDDGVDVGNDYKAFIPKGS